MRLAFEKGLVWTLVPALLLAQQSPPSAAPDAMAMGSLKILILEGDQATNIRSTRTIVPPVVEVRDQNDRPVEGANVTFRGPVDGPGVFFAGQQTSKTVRTNSQGQAMATGMIPNSQDGRFRIHVTATTGRLAGEAVITQTNVNAAEAIREKRSSNRKWLWWSLAAAGVAGGIVGGVLATGGGSTPAPTQPTVVLTPGPVTIGVPR